MAPSLSCPAPPFLGEPEHQAWESHLGYWAKLCDLGWGASVAFLESHGPAGAWPYILHLGWALKEVDKRDFQSKRLPWTC